MISDILLKALFKGKLDSSLDYEIYEKAFLPTASSFKKKVSIKNTVNKRVLVINFIINRLAHENY
jgi:hypothetical protein